MRVDSEWSQSVLKGGNAEIARQKHATQIRLLWR